MKLLVVLAVLALAAAEETYSSENDDLDIEGLVSDSARLKAFYDCFVDAAECDAVQANFKKDLQEAVQQACAKCTAPQKYIMKRFLEGLKQKLPQEYEGFQNKFDPEHKYFSNLEKAIANASP